MRRLPGVLLVSICIYLAGLAPANGQDKTPPPPPVEKADKAEPPPAPPAPPAKYERDGSTMVVHYLLAAIAAIIVMVLICMPVRRE